MDVDAYCNSIQSVLRHALERLLYLRYHIDVKEVDVIIVRYVYVLADSVLINAYMKLHNINFLNPNYLLTFCTKPNAAFSFEVPMSYIRIFFLFVS